VANREINAARIRLEQRNASLQADLRRILRETRAELDREFFEVLNHRRYRAALGSADTAEQANASRKAAKDEIIPRINKKMERLNRELDTFYTDSIPDILDREGNLFARVYTKITPDYLTFEWNTTDADVAETNRQPVFGTSRQEWTKMATDEADGTITRKVKSEMSGQINEPDAETATQSGMVTRIMGQVNKSFNLLDLRTRTLLRNMSINIMNYAEQENQAWLRK